MFVLGHPPDCTYCVWLFSCMLEVVFFDCTDFVWQFCEIFYNVPAWGPVRKHFIFYILNIYVCTWLVRIVHIHRHHMQRSLRRCPVTVVICSWPFNPAFSLGYWSASLGVQLSLAAFWGKLRPSCELGGVFSLLLPSLGVDGQPSPMTGTLAFVKQRTQRISKEPSPSFTAVTFSEGRENITTVLRTKILWSEHLPYVGLSQTKLLFQ